MNSRHTPEEKVRIVMESMKTDITVAELCRKYNLSPTLFYQWKERFLEGGKTALAGRNGDAGRHLQRENERLKRLIGELTIANDAFKKTLEGSRG